MSKSEKVLDEANENLEKVPKDRACRIANRILHGDGHRWLLVIAWFLWAG